MRKVVSILSDENARSLIKGIAMISGVPSICAVRCYNRDEGFLISRTFSKSSGKYVLLGFWDRRNMIIVTDPSAKLNAAVSDLIG